MPPHKSCRPGREGVRPPATGHHVNRANSQLESAAITKKKKSSRPLRTAVEVVLLPLKGVLGIFQ